MVANAAAAAAPKTPAAASAAASPPAKKEQQQQQQKPPAAGASAAPKKEQPPAAAAKTATAPKKEQKPAEPAPAPPAPEAGDADAAAAAPEETLEDKLAEFKDLLGKQIAANQGFAKAATSSLKALEKKIAATVKAASQGKKKQKGAKRANPSGGLGGVAKLSDELCEFLGVPKGTEMPRSQATSRIYEYIKTNDLRNPDNKRIIQPDAKLHKILCLTELKEGENIEYFNIARFIKQNFTRVEPAPAAAAPEQAKGSTSSA